MAELTVSRALPAPPGSVWTALTTESLAAWFWPPRFETTFAANPSVGGRYRVASEPVGMAASGAYSVVEPPNRLAFSWRWDGEDAETRVDITLEPDGAGTTLTLTHTGFDTSESRDDHIQGWNDCLDRLQQSLVE